MSLNNDLNNLSKGPHIWKPGVLISTIFFMCDGTSEVQYIYLDVIIFLCIIKNNKVN